MASNLIKRAPTRNDSRFHINHNTYGYKALDKKKEQGTITEADYQAITNYVTRRRAERDLSEGRVSKIIMALLTWRRYVGPLRQHSIMEIYRGIDALKNGHPLNDPSRSYSKNFISDMIAIIKPFYLWMYGPGYSTVSAKDILNIKRPRRDLMTKTVADILTPEEVKKMVEACTNPRDRALLMMLYDGGFRIGELGCLTWNQVSFDTYGCVVNVDEKTGKPRYVRLIAARPYIAQWKQDFPFDPAGDNLVFVSIRKTPLVYDTIYRQIRKIAERAGIQKNVHPHIFRHTRITDLINKGIPESIVKLMMWGSLTTDMFSCYAHLSNQSIDNALLQDAGIKRPDVSDRADPLAPRQCEQCYTINGPTQNFCGTCGAALNQEAFKSKEELTKFIEQHPELPTLLAKIISSQKRR